ncbi:hypothetical protein A8144_09630 [Mycobacterium leprae 3125609]|nr:hypothetical protein A8144_09630 [Mycobacterium leprae 3125609]OAX70437.1 hypothetical protein A3216_11960 [Mycobacterium leprae 7935681]
MIAAVSVNRLAHHNRQRSSPVTSLDTQQIRDFSLRQEKRAAGLPFTEPSNAVKEPDRSNVSRCNSVNITAVSDGCLARQPIDYDPVLQLQFMTRH